MEDGIGIASNPPPSTPTTSETEEKRQRKSAYRFDKGSRVELLKEVQLVLPFKASHGLVSLKWSEVAAKFGQKFNGDAARKKFYELLAEFAKKESKSKKSSGTEEAYSEEDQLLQGLREVIDEHKIKKETHRDELGAKAKIEAEQAEVIRGAAMSGMAPSQPGTKRRKGAAVMEKLLEDSMAIKKQKLELDQRRVDQEDRRLSLEEQRREDEREEKKAFMSLLISLTKKD